MLPLACFHLWCLHRSYVLLYPTNSLPSGFFIAHSPLHTLLPRVTLISARLDSHASCLNTASAFPHSHAAKLNLPKTRSICSCLSCNVPLMLDVCSPLCGPYRGLRHLTNPIHTLFPPYPNRIALHIYQSLAAPSPEAPQLHLN